MSSFQVLTVCTGNICRSPLAEYYLRSQLDRDRFAVSSAGTRAVLNGRVPPQQVAIAERLGVPGIENHVPRQVSAELIGQADLILTATLKRRRRVCRTVPAATRKTFTIREFAQIAHEITVADLREFQERGLSALESSVAASNLLRSAAARLSDNELNIVDPFGQSDDVYEQSAADLIPAVRDIASFLTLIAQRDHRTDSDRSQFIDSGVLRLPDLSKSDPALAPPTVVTTESAVTRSPIPSHRASIASPQHVSNSGSLWGARDVTEGNRQDSRNRPQRSARHNIDAIIAGAPNTDSVTKPRTNKKDILRARHWRAY